MYNQEIKKQAEKNLHFAMKIVDQAIKFKDLIQAYPQASEPTQKLLLYNMIHQMWVSLNATGEAKWVYWEMDEDTLTRLTSVYQEQNNIGFIENMKKADANIGLADTGKFLALESFKKSYANKLASSKTSASQALVPEQKPLNSLPLKTENSLQESKPINGNAIKKTKTLLLHDLIPRLAELGFEGTQNYIRKNIHQNNVNAQQRFSTPLHKLIRQEVYDIAEFLIITAKEKKILIDFSVKNASDETTLLRAVKMHAPLSIIELILDNLSKKSKQKIVNMQDINGNTALHYAALYGYKAAYDMLCEKGNANREIQNNIGVKPLDLLQKEHMSLIEEVFDEAKIDSKRSSSAISNYVQIGFCHNTEWRPLYQNKSYFKTLLEEGETQANEKGIVFDSGQFKQRYQNLNKGSLYEACIGARLRWLNKLEREKVLPSKGSSNNNMNFQRMKKNSKRKSLGAAVAANNQNNGIAALVKPTSPLPIKSSIVCPSLLSASIEDLPIVPVSTPGTPISLGKNTHTFFIENTHAPTTQGEKITLKEEDNFSEKDAQPQENDFNFNDKSYNRLYKLFVEQLKPKEIESEKGKAEQATYEAYKELLEEWEKEYSEGNSFNNAF